MISGLKKSNKRRLKLRRSNTSYVHKGPVQVTKANSLHQNSELSSKSNIPIALRECDPRVCPNSERERDSKTLPFIISR